MTAYQPLIETLLKSPEPSVRWKTLANVLGEPESSPKLKALQAEIKDCDRVKALLKKRDERGRTTSGKDVYAKWQGAHWVMASLADIGYPPGDESLYPVRDQLLDAWLGEEFYKEFEPKSKAAAYGNRAVPVMHGRHRAHASQQGNALWSILMLGLRDNRTDRLVERLLHWQWPDGGWNCDKNPDAHVSSFTETWLPLRGLSLYARTTGNGTARDAADRAAEFLLERYLYRRKTNGNQLQSEFMRLHYPLYWHYDILCGLKVMAEGGYLNDPRCKDALELLMEKRLPDGGWPAESSYYRLTTDNRLGGELVDWGGTSKRTFNEWVTVDTLFVLKTAGMIEV